MAYKRVHNIKKSIYQFISDAVNVEGTYIIGDGSTMLSFYDSFPVEPTTFRQPSMSIDFARIVPRRQYDLGVEATYPYDFIIDLFGRNNYEDEYIASIITDAFNGGLVDFRDYNLNPYGACILGSIYIKNVDASAMRIESPGLESEYRFRVTFMAEYNDLY
jgi:hypothetical protein